MQPNQNTRTDNSNPPQTEYPTNTRLIPAQHWLVAANSMLCWWVMQLHSSGISTLDVNLPSGTRLPDSFAAPKWHCTTEHMRTTIATISHSVCTYLEVGEVGCCCCCCQEAKGKKRHKMSMCMRMNYETH